MTFRALSADSPDTLTTVARFLALLELFREGAVSFDQVTPLGELTVRWTGAEDGEVEITDEFDGAPPEPTTSTGAESGPHDDDRAHRRGASTTAATSRRADLAEDDRRATDGPQAAEPRRPRTTPETLEVPLAELRPALEAVLMVADQPLDHLTLAPAVGLPAQRGAAALAELAEEYAEQGRGFDLRNVAGGWRFYTREEFAPRRRAVRASTASRPG